MQRSTAALPAALLVIIASLPAPAVAGPSKVEVTGKGSLRVNGRPFFPVLAWNVPRKRVAFNRELGVNCITPGESPAKEGPRTALLDDLHASGMMAMVDASEYSPEIARHPALLGWKFGDEPDMKGITAERIRPRHDEIRRRDPRHPTWINLTARFWGHYHESYLKRGKCPDRDGYLAYGECAEIMGFDHYPVTGWNRPDRVAEVYHATRDLASLYPRHVRMVFVEDADQDLKWTPPRTRGPTPEETRAMVWMAVVGGAKGIGYFHIAFNPFRWDNLTPGMREELPRLNARLQRFAPALLEGDLVGANADTPDVAARALRHEGATYVFAVNLSRERRSARVTVPGIGGSGSVEDEGRRVRAARGAFTDDFRPLAEHVYIFR
ncbi:MAG: hypothetical protein ACYS9X_28525 [Planctomycetota bacterium]